MKVCGGPEISWDIRQNSFSSTSRNSSASRADRNDAIHTRRALRSDLVVDTCASVRNVVKIPIVNCGE